MDLESKLTQQQSSGRAMVSEATITEFKTDVIEPMLAEPENGGLTLNDVGNGDEWWFDLNKLLQSKTVGLRGEEHRQEVPSERSAHVTVFSGACGYESSKVERDLERAAGRAAAAGLGAPAGAGGDATIGYNLTELQRKTIYSRPASLDSMGLSDSDIISDEEFTWLSQLSLDSWDSPNFFIYPVLVLVARAAGPNDNWTKHCKSDKMFVGTTSDGWMDEHMKFEWYQHSKSFPHSPFGDANRRMIDQRDQHYSNESIRQSLQQEADGNIGIGTPGHHTAALQHMDQRGGPIQHANRYARALIRRENRARGEITIPAMLRIIEISVAASHTPKIFSYATRRVGWYEDENGRLAYDPMATCDKSVLTAVPTAPLIRYLTAYLSHSIKGLVVFKRTCPAHESQCNPREDKFAILASAEVRLGGPQRSIKSGSLI